MKKITALIIGLAILFSSISHVFAIDNYRNQYSSGFLENLLDLNVGPEKLEIASIKIHDIYLSDPRQKEILKQTQIFHNEINQSIIKAYRNKTLDSNELNALTSSQTKFAYHSNQYFYFLRLKERFPNYTEADIYMIDSYKNMRVYLRKTKRILSVAHKF